MSQPRCLASIKSSLASHHKPCVLAFFQPTHFEPSQSPQSQCLAFRLSQTISSRVSHHNLDADSQPFQFEPNQSPQPRCSGLHPIEAIGTTSVTTISVLCSSSNETNLSHVGHHKLGVLAFHLPTSPTVTNNLVSYSSSSNQPWKPIRATSVTTYSVSGHQSVQTTSLLLVTYTLGVPLSSPKLYSQSSISVSHFHLSADFPAHRFASIRTSSVTTTSVSVDSLSLFSPYPAMITPISVSGYQPTALP